MNMLRDPLFIQRPLRQLKYEIFCDRENVPHGSDIHARFAKALEFPIIPCDLCGSQDGLQRAEVKKLLQGWERDNPGRLSVMARALSNVRPSHLHDQRVFDFAELAPEGADTPADAREEPEACGAGLAMTARLFAAE